jgi:hypothetical protein
MTDYSGIPTYVARRVQRGWWMTGVGVIDQVTTHINGHVTFSGPSGHRTFALDALVQADPHWDDDDDDDE